MKLTEIPPPDNRGAGPDRLTSVLIALAIFLVAALAAITADLWSWPVPTDSRAQVAELNLPLPTSTTSVVPTRSPTVWGVEGNRSNEPLTPVPSTPTSSTPPPCIPPDDWGIHIVEPGSTLHSLAQRYGTDVQILMRVNCLNTNTIFANQRLYVPGGSAIHISTILAARMSPVAIPTSTPRLDPSATSLPTVAASATPSTPPSATPTPTRRPGATATPASVTSAGDTPRARPDIASANAERRDTLAAPGFTGAAAGSVPEPAAASAAIMMPTPAPLANPKVTFRVDIPNRYLHILLLGSDKRPSSAAWRTDSMIVVSVDMENNIIRLLSIPRDLWVYIPGHGNDRINTAELWGELAKKGTGTARVKQTIQRNLGIPIHYYVRVDFRGFIKIIDTVGGVDVDVDCPLPDIKLTAGVHHMDGTQALRYCRSRKSTSDFDRGRRQRKVLMALWDQALTMDIIPKLPSLWVTMADSFETDLPLDQVINLAYVGVRLKPQYILSRAIGSSHVTGWMTPQGASVLLPREDKIRALLESFYAPSDRSGLDAMDKVRVRILNGTKRRDAEQLAAASLRWDGFKVAGTGQADHQDYLKTQIWVHKGALATGAQIAQRLRVPVTAVGEMTATQVQSESEDVQVILGKDYNPCAR